MGSIILSLLMMLLLVSGCILLGNAASLPSDLRSISLQSDEHQFTAMVMGADKMHVVELKQLTMSRATRYLPTTFKGENASVRTGREALEGVVVIEPKCDRYAEVVRFHELELFAILCEYSSVHLARSYMHKTKERLLEQCITTRDYPIGSEGTLCVAEKPDVGTKYGIVFRRKEIAASIIAGSISDLNDYLRLIPIAPTVCKLDWFKISMEPRLATTAPGSTVKFNVILDWYPRLLSDCYIKVEISVSREAALGGAMEEVASMPVRLSEVEPPVMVSIPEFRVPLVPGKYMVRASAEYDNRVSTDTTYVTTRVGFPGFEALTALLGVIGTAYYMLRRRQFKLTI